MIVGTAKRRHFAAFGYAPLRPWGDKGRLNRKGAFAVIDCGDYVRPNLREIFNRVFEIAFLHLVKSFDF